MTTSKRTRGPDKEARGKSRRLEAKEFDALLPFLDRFSEKSITAARLAMVDGKKFDDIAGLVGWNSRQAVSRVVKAVWLIHLRLVQSRIASEDVE